MALTKTSIFLSLVVLGMWASLADCRSFSERHEQWMARYGCEYEDDAEKAKRFQIFKSNVEYIESFNSAGNKGYKLAINDFADQTNEEFRASRNGYKRSSTPRPVNTAFRYESVSAVPPTVDWRKKGAVSPVKDQGQCGN